MLPLRVYTDGIRCMIVAMVNRSDDPTKCHAFLTYLWGNCNVSKAGMNALDVNSLQITVHQTFH